MANKNKIPVSVSVQSKTVECKLIWLSPLRTEIFKSLSYILSDEGKMDSVQIFFICLEDVYYICILLHSSKKYYKATFCYFLLRKNDIGYY